MGDLHLSDEQARALDAVTAALHVRDHVPAVLVGPAGTGKTTILGALAERLADRAIRYAAPTGRAAKVLSEKLKARGVLSGASTIHRALYRGARETDKGLVFDDTQEPVTAGGVLIIDEASMVGRQIHADIMSKLPARSSLLYVGDREQLPPVTRDQDADISPWGPDFENPTAALTEVHRQALESPIVRVATAIRTGGKIPVESEPGFERHTTDNDGPAAWLADACRAGQDAVVLAYTNGCRAMTNRIVRSSLGLAGGAPIVVGDRLVVTFNAYDADLMNGEVIDVAEVKPVVLTAAQRRAGIVDADIVEIRTACGKVVRTSVPLLGGSANDFKIVRRKLNDGEDFLPDPPLILADYGWALTVHKSQGSEWRQVAFVLDDSFHNLCRRDGPTGRRMLYTAVTRARENLHIFDVRR